MRVLLAGGGTAGHTSPLIATADALRRLDPDIEITCLGTSRGLETRVVPEAGYPLELIPPVPLPRRPNARLLQGPVPAARGGQGDARGPRPGAARRGRRLRRLRLDAGVPRRAQAEAAAGDPRAERRCPASPTRPAPGSRQRVAVSFPDTPLRKAEYVGLPIRPMISGLDRACAARRGAGVLRPRPRPADAAGDRRLAGRASAQPGGVRCGRRRWPRPACRCCTRQGKHGGADARSGTDVPYVVVELHRPDGPAPTPPPTWWSAGPAPTA